MYENNFCKILQYMFKYLLDGNFGNGYFHFQLKRYFENEELIYKLIHSFPWRIYLKLFGLMNIRYYML